ncbi:UPF0496 protein At1g20180 [Silene latifolia]|uniref:UPF0496 protein At1g20180 n=1 Tax=Silene latifolia TaxID=37657 RepID=UPI003D76CF50
MGSETRSTRMSEFWPRLMRSPFRSKKGRSKKKDMEDEEGGLRKKLNVNEEYKQVFRSKSYVDIWSRVQLQLKGSPPISHKRNSSSSSSSSSSLSASCPLSSFSSSPFISSPISRYTHLPNCLLEPRQEVVLESIKSSKLQVLLKDYFEVTLEAYNVCELLLRGIHKTRSNHRIIKRVLTLSTTEEETTDYEMLIQELASFARSSNPLSFIINGTVEFPGIHDQHAILLQKLTSRRRRIKRRGKFIKFYKKVASYSFLIVYTALAIALLTLALHSVVGLLGAPALLFPFSTGVFKKVDCESLNPSALERMGAQVDIAAKGAYILINDFDTMARLAARVHDEVEHQRAVSQMCVRNSESSEVVKEAIRELRMHEGRFAEQLEELEEHVYLCFLTINRSRRLVVDEILG